MVKISGEQNIPSALRLPYKATLTEQGDNNFCKKRSPFRIPKMQAGGVHVRDAQIVQRQRFKDNVEQFNQTSQAERQRWYNRMPIWNSYLWYYNYFMLNGISGGLGPQGVGAGVINSIQVKYGSVPTTGGKSFTIDEVDPTRTVVLPYGNSYIADKIHTYQGTMADDTETTITLSPNVDADISEVIIDCNVGYENIGEGSGEGNWAKARITSFTDSQLKIKLDDIGSAGTHGYSVQIIEHKAQTIYPIPTAIAATSVTVDWSKEPSVAADVSVIVIEYI